MDAHAHDVRYGLDIPSAVMMSDEERSATGNRVIAANE